MVINVCHIEVLLLLLILLVAEVDLTLSGHALLTGRVIAASARGALQKGLIF